MQEQILAVNIGAEQTLEVNLPEQDNVAQIDVYWQDEVTLDLDASLMYIVSGKQEIQDYVDNKSKPEIDEYIETYAKSIVAEVVEQEATPIVDEYFYGTVKPSITEFAEKEMAGYAATATEQATIASTQAGLSEASALSAIATAQNVDTKVAEFETTKNNAISSVNQAKTTAITAIDNETALGKSELNVIASDAQQYATQASNSATQTKADREAVEEIAQKIKGVVHTVEGNVGDIGFAPLGIDEAQNKRRYLNGQVISQAQFVSFTAKVKNAILLYPSLGATEENWQAEVTNSVLGQCGKFVIDDAMGTIRLPKVVNVQGLADLSLTGGIKAESLPNIKGESSTIKMAGTASSATGCITEKDVSTSVAISTGSVDDWRKLSFDASRSSSAYQNNAPVQQEAIQYPYFIQVATGVEESVDVTREIELNNPFSLLDYKWSEYELNNASWLLSNGAFHSGATYVAVYEILLKIHNGTETKDGVSVKLSTEDYEDTDFVINTADMTFRLPIKVKLASGNAVVGNGMALGLTDGVNDYGFGVQLETINVNLGSVNFTNAGASVSTSSSGRHPKAGVYGVTTDPENSGIETSSSGLYLYFYVGETIQDANVIVASNALTDIANIGSRTHIVETYSNGASWYRVWSDGWCEQGGRIKGIDTGTSLTLIKPYKDTNYDGFVQQSVSTYSTDAYCGEVSFKVVTNGTAKLHTGVRAGVNVRWFAYGYIR